MFSILETTNCTNYVLGYYLSIVKTILTILQVTAPIVFLLSLAISFFKMIVLGEDKKVTKGIFQKIITVIIFFLLPWIVELVLNLVVIDDVDKSVQYTLGNCWQNAESLRDSINQEEDKGVNTGTGSSTLLPDTSGIDDFETPAEKPDKKPTKLVFIGDSRTEGMSYVVGSNDVWCYQSGGMYKWFAGEEPSQAQCILTIDNQITKNTGVIILMGVNDLGDVNKYATYINTKAKSWVAKGAVVYFVSVLPTNGKRDSLNSRINSFNKTIQQKLSSNVYYIDANSYLKKNGFNASDGLHYTPSTYKDIYNFIKKNL